MDFVQGVLKVMTIENEAFIDLEAALHNKTNALWVKEWREIQKKLNKLVNAGKWDEAHKFADELNFDTIVRKSTRLAHTLAEAALFLGASRIVDPENAVFASNPDEDLLIRAVEQWAIILTSNAQEALRLQIHIILGDLERKHAEDKMIIKADPDLSRVGKQGTQFSRATASLMISRMSTAGFLAQATASGIQEYVVSEVMDAATCPICATMHNKHFPVPAGVARSSAIMQAVDTDALKAIAPFPSQSAVNVKRIGKLDQGGLISNGLELPPYHPYCRGIVTIESSVGAPLDIGITASGVSAGRLLHSSEDLTPEQLQNRLFGDIADLDELFMDSVLGVGSGALFGVGIALFDDEDEEEEDLP